MTINLSKIQKYQSKTLEKYKQTPKTFNKNITCYAILY